MKKYLIVERTIHGNGEQKIFKFENGYGASVVRHSFSYGGNFGLWELAIIKNIKGDNATNISFNLCYDTVITNDVIGRLTENEVLETLNKIKEL